MKQQYLAVELDQTRYLLFDMSAFYDMEQEYHSIPKTLLALKLNPITELAKVLRIGLAHGVQLPEDHIELCINVDNRILLTQQVVNAISIALPNSKKESSTSQPTPDQEGWDWAWIYYIGTVLLGMSEAVFWRCTPKKLFALWDAHKKYHGLEDGAEQAKTSTSYIDQFI